MTLKLRPFVPMCGFGGKPGAMVSLRELAMVLNTELEINPHLSVSALDVMRRFSKIPANADFTLNLNVDPTTGTPPLTLSILVGASIGASPVIRTNLDIFDSAGKSIFALQNHYLGGGSFFEETSLPIGSYQASAVRTAATQHGPATLTRSAHIVVAKKQEPPPPPPPSPTISIAVTKKTDPSEILTVSGGGFQQNEKVIIDEWIDFGGKLEHQTSFDATADGLGYYRNADVGVTRPAFPDSTDYVFQASGASSGLKSPQVHHRTS